MASSYLSKKSQFWTLCQLVPGSESLGYQNRPHAIARSFFQDFFQSKFSQLSDSQSRAIALLALFRDRNVATAEAERQSAHAGLCLRCWISHPILTACLKLANLFGTTGQFSYRDLLPFVLTDDGSQLVVPTPDGGQYRVLGESDGDESRPYVCFSLDVLRTYRLDASNSPTKKQSLSLLNWVHLQTKQHPEVTNFLAEFGFQKLSDWALLNRVRVGQLEQLSEHDRALIHVFHEVYRRDRRLNLSSGRCPNPNPAQLQEMTTLLTQKAMTLSADDLLNALKQVAFQLRQFDVWRSRESLETFHSDYGEYLTRSDLPTQSLDIVDTEELDMLLLLKQQLTEVLAESFRQVIRARIAKLNKSKKYSPFADQYILGLQYYYRDRISLREMPSLLGMSSNDQARRILDPGGLLTQVRSLTLQQLLAQILAVVEEKALAPWPPSPDYLQQLSEQLETFVDDEIFQAAAAEMKAGSYRTLESPYAQTLLSILDSFYSHPQTSGTV